MIKSVHEVTYAQYLRNKINHLINSLERCPSTQHQVPIGNN